MSSSISLFSVLQFLLYGFFTPLVLFLGIFDDVVNVIFPNIFLANLLLVYSKVACFVY